MNEAFPFFNDRMKRHEKKRTKTIKLPLECVCTLMFLPTSIAGQTNKKPTTLCSTFSCFECLTYSFQCISLHFIFLFHFLCVHFAIFVKFLFENYSKRLLICCSSCVFEFLFTCHSNMWYVVRNIATINYNYSQLMDWSDFHEFMNIHIIVSPFHSNVIEKQIICHLINSERTGVGGVCSGDQ